jgi:hypothetical protein
MKNKVKKYSDLRPGDTLFFSNLSTTPFLLYTWFTVLGISSEVTPRDIFCQGFSTFFVLVVTHNPSTNVTRTMVETVRWFLDRKLPDYPEAIIFRSYEDVHR